MNETVTDLQEYRGDRESTTALVLDPTSIQSMMSLAKTMSESRVTVPDHLKSPGDCLAVIMQAMQWGMNPFAVAQKTHLVNGKLGYEAQLVNAVVSASGAIKGRFHYEYQGEGDALCCRVGAILRGENEITWNEWLCIADVTTKNSPLWKTNKKQQLGYLQLKNWTRQYAPGAILGVYTVDELQAEVELNPRQQQGSAKRDELPFYSDEDFNTNFPKWEQIIESGKKSPQQIIDTVSSKAVLTEGQRQAILDLTPVTETEGAQS
ncbi:RecT family recombinase [Pseudohongiella sp. O18]|uniref:RecT family recombinase n=1 Tax=Pseudohongiella sp. O18 TaxID=2904248 RepID=UPI001F1D9DE8|nr:RecT family recombinase [Pseudohongiella sp. O18]